MSLLPEEKREIRNAALAGVLFWCAAFFLCAGCESPKEPTQVLPAPGEHSVLVNRETAPHWNPTEGRMIPK